jgi:hypothetical protein
MPSFRSGRVCELLQERKGLQRVHVDLGAGAEKAYVLTQLTGPVALDDEVVVNTTAVELGLGTGGWHVVHWNLSRGAWSETGSGHIMKARYTSLQTDVGSSEEHAGELLDIDSIDGLPVVACGLHSQVPAVAVAFKHLAPDARLVFVMTDGAALPLALSDLVFALRERDLLDTTITCGHAFGGDYEAVSIYSALAIAHQMCSADAVVVAMGPGIVGTNTRLGFSGIEVGPVLDATVGLHGTAIAALRASGADQRERHQGVSHHSVTALTTATRSRVTVAVPDGLAVPDAIAARHDLVAVPAQGIVGLMEARGLHVESMGRSAADDPLLFESAAAAGAVAAQRLP